MGRAGFLIVLVGSVVGFECYSLVRFEESSFSGSKNRALRDLLGTILSGSKKPEPLSAPDVLNASSRPSFNDSLGPGRDVHPVNLSKRSFFSNNRPLASPLRILADEKEAAACPICVPDQNIEDTAALCPRWGPDHWLKCREALADKLLLGNITCPQACVTLERFGRFNNNILQLANTIMTFVNPNLVTAAMRRSIVLDGFWKPDWGAKFDFDQLARVCVFPSWNISGRPRVVGGCKRVTGVESYYGQNIPLGSTRALKNQMISWILVGAVSRTNRREIDAQLAKLGHDFSTLHARFLEGSCIARHTGKGTADICHLKPQFVESEMKKLGHSEQVFVVCTDRQRQDLVNPLIAHMHGTLSTNSAPLLDLFLMIHSKRFLGNKASTMSANIQRVRTTVFGDVSGALK